MFCLARDHSGGFEDAYSTTRRATSRDTFSTAVARYVKTRSQVPGLRAITFNPDNRQTFADDFLTFVDNFVPLRTKMLKLDAIDLVARVPPTLMKGLIFWRPAGKTAGVASPQAQLTEVIEKASKSPTRFLKIPTAVQLPGDAQDTEWNPASGLVFCTPAEKTAG